MQVQECRLEIFITFASIAKTSPNSVNILGLCEAFLNKHVYNKTVSIEGYTFERKDRNQCTGIATDNGGGILMYFENRVNYRRRSGIESHNIESIWIEVQIRNSKPFLLCSVYQPPSATNDWFEKFAPQIETSLSDCNEVYIMGDINIEIKMGGNSFQKRLLKTR